MSMRPPTFTTTFTPTLNLFDPASISAVANALPAGAVDTIAASTSVTTTVATTRSAALASFFAGFQRAGVPQLWQRRFKYWNEEMVNLESESVIAGVEIEDDTGV